MLKNKSLEEILHSLNPAQKKAVEHIEGPVLVIAGPGTGKTQSGRRKEAQ
jgi:DNA helicase-2/ATP-dependent DNA helicase PcrA